MKALDQLIKTALLGTSRAPVESIDWTEQIHIKLQKYTKNDAETLLLNGATLIFSFQDGGKLFPQSSYPVKVAPEEQNPCCSKKAAQLLKRILQENQLTLLQQWLQACHQSQQLPAPGFLPELLDTGRKHVFIRSYIQSIMGERGKWLANMNHEWQYILQSQEQIWETGKPEERKQLLVTLRKDNPQAALALLQSSWKSESADLRAEFLTLLEIRLSAQDLPFLEETLLDKSKKVKSTALNLLLLQKESFVVQNIFQAASAMLEVKKGKSFFGLNGPNLTFMLASMDQQLAEYGVNLESLDKNFSNEEYYTYELMEVIEPSQWENHFQMEPSAIVKAFLKDDTLVKFIPALIEATVLHQNTQWASVFAECLRHSKFKLPKEKQYLKQEIVRVLSSQDKIEFFPAPWSDLNLIEYLQGCDFPWSMDFSRKALQELYQRYADSGVNPYEKDKIVSLYAYLHSGLLKEKKNYLPPDHERKASWREVLDLLFNALELKISIQLAFKS